MGDREGNRSGHPASLLRIYRQAGHRIPAPQTGERRMSTLLAYHGEPAIKDKYLARVAAHRAADQIIHGKYWENGKGCAVGCTIHSGNHAAYETELGIPVMLARLEDVIFEGMGNGNASTWPERFLSAIRPSADLSLVGWKFLLWLFEDTQARYATDAVRKACEPVGVILRDKAEGRQSAARAGGSAAWGAGW